MKNSNFKTAYTLSVVIAILATIASAGGLFLKNLYRDVAFFKLAFQGNDVVTLFVAVPLLIAGMAYTKRGSERAPPLLGLCAGGDDDAQRRHLWAGAACDGGVCGRIQFVWFLGPPDAILRFCCGRRHGYRLVATSQFWKKMT